MTDTVFVDTNIYIYAAVESNGTKHRIASDLLSRLSQTAPIIASTQTIGEFYTAMSKNNRPHEEIMSFIDEIIDGADVKTVTLEIIEQCFVLRKRYNYTYWDSLLLATALHSGCEVFYSEDMQDGQVIEDTITIRNPFAIKNSI
jgi:predicted nucleic acid-binding protein